MKIAVIGYSGSGKSTLAQFLGQRYGVPVLHLDRVHFAENWRERDNDEALPEVRRFLCRDGWVIDGNYSGLLQAERLAQADWIVLMLFSRIACFFRALRRYRHFRGVSRESMADGCQEKFDLAFARWILHDGRVEKYRRRYQAICDQYPQKTVILRNQRELNRFRRGLDTEFFVSAKQKTERSI